jgi:polyisoprenoid-binding protein YceI
MKTLVIRRWLDLGTAGAWLFLLTAAPAANRDSQLTVTVRDGVATFDAATNVPGIRIHGKSTSLSARAAIRSGEAGIVVDRLEATIPVKTLNTGMGLRDDHMRKYVFTTADGRVPDLRFAAENVSCAGSDGVSNCQVAGHLEIRGKTEPCEIALKVARDGAAFRAVGDTTVKLSAYDIPAPSQLGVRTEDEIKVHLEFVAKPSSDDVASGGVK